MSFATLAGHSSIGWDFDGTLYADHEGNPHPKMVAMHEFIKANPQIKHYIVTFRSHGWQNRVFSDLGEFESSPHPICFERIINIPDETYEAFQKARRTLGRDDCNMDDIYAYLEWKGMVCQQHGIGVLVDDLADMVTQGCTKHGVVYIHPDDL